MKLRIRGNSIRLRLTQSEVEKIKNSGFVEEKTEFPDEKDFIYSISVTEKENLSANFSDGKIEILIPKSGKENWVNSSEVGIYGTYGEIQISVEKDFKCLTVRESEDESDNFPHLIADKNC